MIRKSLSHIFVYFHLYLPSLLAAAGAAGGGLQPLSWRSSSAAAEDAAVRCSSRGPEEARPATKESQITGTRQWLENSSPYMK